MARTMKKLKKPLRARRPTRKPAPDASSAVANGPDFKTQFLSMFQREHATTMKVLRAFPPDQAEFRPHPRSQCARELAFTFLMEQALLANTIISTGMDKTIMGRM